MNDTLAKPKTGSIASLASLHYSVTLRGAGGRVVLKLILGWKLLLLTKKLFSFSFFTSVLLCNGLKSEGGREPWFMSQVPVSDSHTILIIKPPVRMKINL